MREIKFRMWSSLSNCFWYFDLNTEFYGGDSDCVPIADQFTGLQDKNGIDIYVGDIREFSNGDRFILEMEDWLEVFIKWVGAPKCEDQARDLYRISESNLIGTIHQNPELLEQSK